LSYAIELFNRSIFFSGAMRWLHVIVGITWIGLLYYFNLVQVPAFAQMDPAARSDAIDKVARRALWWFRWAAVATVIFGLLITGSDHYFQGFMKRADGLAILIGMILGLVMFLNVWGVIWRNQKVVLANAASTLAGGAAVPGAAEAGRRTLLASRQNFIFSVPMLWFMVGTAHIYKAGAFGRTIGANSAGDIVGLLSGSKVAAWLIITLVIIAVLELNALGVFGTKPGQANLWIYENHRNAIASAFVLWAIFWILSEILLRR
jgi:hypothetical protein